ncbi:hypothetical protein ID866_10343 [Astraeus odoratus]|nr:hypothetical protein ID866_10343 [Astraeus odoratus]
MFHIIQAIEELERGLTYPSTLLGTNRNAKKSRTYATSGNKGFGLPSVLYNFMAAVRPPLALPTLRSFGSTYQLRFIPQTRVTGKEPTESNPTQITLTLSPKNAHGSKSTPVVWQILDLQRDEKEYLVDIPRDVAVGVASDNTTPNNALQCQHFYYVPRRRAIIAKAHLGSVKFETPSKGYLSGEKQILVKNDTGKSQRIALGSYHKDQSKREPPQFKPFLVTELQHAESFACEQPLILNAYQTLGQIIAPETAENLEPLFSPSGLNIAELKQVSVWRIVLDEQERVQLVSDTPSKSQAATTS